MIANLLLHKYKNMRGDVDMSKIDQYIAKRSKQSADFAKEYKEENQRLQELKVEK